MKGQLYKFLLISFLGVFFIACKEDETLFLNAPRVDGLRAKAPVSINGYQVGSVKGLSLQKDASILIEVDLEEIPELKSDTRFEIHSKDLLGNKEIRIIPGTAPRLLSYKDTLPVLNMKAITTDSVLKNGVQGFIKTLSGNRKEDSILSELKTLNRKLKVKGSLDTNRINQN